MSVAPRTLVLCLAWLLLTWPAQAGRRQQDSVIVVMIDGLRWEEVFRGADPLLMNAESGGVHELEATQAAWWRDTPEERRAALLPFLWGTVGVQGQLIGNQDKGSSGHIRNGRHKSYPGYSELLCGYVDPQIVDNSKIDNPNATVLEWLHQQPGLQGHVAAFGAWDVFPYIFNRGRAGFPINAGFEPLELRRRQPALDTLNRLKAEMTRIWPGEPLDALTAETALLYLREEAPRLLFLSLGESDEWGHAGRYDLYLQAAQRADRSIQTIWEAAQAMPQYRGRTTLIVATDHGRGAAPTLWKSHGADNPGSESTWYGFLGPRTAATGEWSGGPVVEQDQIAATIAALLGHDYNVAEPRAGLPVVQVLGR